MASKKTRKEYKPPANPEISPIVAGGPLSKKLTAQLHRQLIRAPSTCYFELLQAWHPACYIVVTT